MKILFINDSIFSVGGVQRVLSCIASELTIKHDVTILTFEHKMEENRALYGLSNRVRVDFMNNIYKRCYFRRALHKLNQKTGLFKVLGCGFLYDWTYIPKRVQKQWIDYINKNNYDIVCGVQGNNAIILGKIKDKISCKTLGWQHNSYEAYLEKKGTYYYNQDYLFEKYIRQLDKYIVLNEHDEEMFKLKKNIDTVTIYNPKSFISEKKSQVMNKKFIACGGLRTAKGFDFLIESYAVFFKQNREWEVNIWGEGPDEEKLHKAIVDKGLDGHIKLMGVTDNIAEKMLDSSALLLSSRWEGMPMVVLEALECGLPIISYNITAITPLVTDDVEGRIVPAFDTKQFAEAMLEVAQNEEKRKRYASNAAKKAQNFTIEVIINKWESLIRELVKTI